MQAHVERIQMTVQDITDRNYSSFKQGERAALVVGATWCPYCQVYDPTVQQLSDRLCMVNFGKAEIDKGHLRQLKRDYQLKAWALPTTLLFKTCREVARFEGCYPYEMAFDEIMDKLVVGSTVYVRSEAADIPASIDTAEGDLFVVKLLEDSQAGKKGALIQVKNGEFNWDR